jgi:O-6-methylguanine DNA methyltransferase
VAAEMGNPRAVRAVARACASNPVALVVPCHRVVAADGKLTGFRWGIERKRMLLEKERGQSAAASTGSSDSTRESSAVK